MGDDREVELPEVEVGLVLKHPVVVDTGVEDTDVEVEAAREP